MASDYSDRLLDDQTKVGRRRRAPRVETIQNIRGLMKIGETEMPVGFEVSALRPFVPSVDEHEPLRRLELVQRALASMRQPNPIFFRRGKCKDGAFPRLAGLIVPTWAHAGEKFVIGLRYRSGMVH